VAALWTWFLAASDHVRLPRTSILAMAIAVWMLYAADRLLDARLLQNAADSTPLHCGLYEQLEPRHLFHYRHRRVFRGGIALCSITLALLLPQLMHAAVRLYLILGRPRTLPSREFPGSRHPELPIAFPRSSPLASSSPPRPLSQPSRANPRCVPSCFPRPCSSPFSAV
jgi:hypothetical protein